MFPHGYFAAGFFPPGYFPPALAIEAEEETGPINPGLLGSGGIPGNPYDGVEDPGVKYVKHIRGYFSQLRESPVYEKQPALEARIDALSSKSSLLEISDASDAIQALVQTLLSLRGPEALSLPPPPTMPPVILERVGDEIRQRLLEDDDDELLMMMLLQ